VLPRTPLPADEVPASDPKTPTDAEAAEKESERLDEELDETFPASDPIPFQHDT
jgi:hypothetical protein